jgi:hypothetical protein
METANAAGARTVLNDRSAVADRQSGLERPGLKSDESPKVNAAHSPVEV